MRCRCRKKSETEAYADCCQPLHDGVRAAATAEALMRSRYAAFAMRNARYLSSTWHPSTHPAEITFTTGQEWLGLRILAAREQGNTATVEFVARSRIGGRTDALHETSRFRRENSRWYYVDGVIT